MKQINEYITERLKISSNIETKYHPKDKNELQNIIIEILENDGRNANLNNIDTSQIMDMTRVFSDINRDTPLRICNIDISYWDVSNVKLMDYMFSGCKEFNCDLSHWNVSQVTNMFDMFRDCNKFNCDLSKWDVSSCKNMAELFCGCYAFNSDLSKWNTKKVWNMYRMFDYCESMKELPQWYINWVDKNK